MYAAPIGDTARVDGAEPADRWWERPVPGTAGLSDEELVDRLRRDPDDTTVGITDELGRRGSSVALRAARALLREADTALAQAGAWVLHSVFEAADASGREVPGDLVDALLAAVPAGADTALVDAVCSALSGSGDARALPWLTGLADSPIAEVRTALAMGFVRLDLVAPGVLATLRRLLDDPDDEVRDWATFAVSHTDDALTPDVLDRLLELASSDVRAVTRYQAISALAVRGDRRVLAAFASALATPLSDDDADPVDLQQLWEAAERLPDPELLLPGIRTWQQGTAGSDAPRSG